MCSFDDDTSPATPEQPQQPQEAQENQGNQETQGNQAQPENQEAQKPVSEAAQPARQPQAEAAPRRKASPYENSPFVSAFDEAPLPPKKTRKPKKPRAVRPALRRGGAAVIAAAVLFGACAVTYQLSASRARREAAGSLAALSAQVEKLQSQVNALNRSDGISHSGTGAQTEGLTPGQVYARNVSSVVAISCQADMTVGGQTVRSTLSGSGFILSEDGYIVTNYHVVENVQSVTVTTQSDDSYEAAVVGHDSTADMALLKIEAEDLPAVTLGSSSDLIIGDMVVAIGNPLGTLNATQTVGYISGINREVTTDNNVTNMLQTDAAINSGNSGGPLFNMKGEVVGIITAKYSGTSSSGASIEGIGFAIPIDDLKKSLEDLQTQGYIRSAYLGIMGKDVSQEAVETYGLPSGTYVDSVTPDSPAAQAGLQAKDIIIRLGDTKIDSFNALARALRGFAPGDKTTITVYRGGKELTFSITLAEKPREDAAGQEDIGMPEEGSFQEWFDYFNHFQNENP